MQNNIMNYLVQYGASAFVGRFSAAFSYSLPRGETVVIRSPRGSERGTILCEVDPLLPNALTSEGELLRRCNCEDDEWDELNHSLAVALLAAADQSQLPVVFLDAEVLGQRSLAILHVLPAGPCELDPLLLELSERFGLPVRVLDVSRTETVPEPPETAGCGKPGCGTESGGGCGSGGGCSTGGGCSKGKVKSAEELTAYFSDLRHRMEADTVRVPLN